MLNRLFFAGIALLSMAGLSGCPWPVFVPVTVSIDPPEAGLVYIQPEANAYAQGMTVTLTAQPQPGWRFLQWEGPVTTPTLPVTTLKASRNTEFIARFTPAFAGGAVESPISLDAEGTTQEPTTLTVPGGSQLQLPKGARILNTEIEDPQGQYTLQLQDGIVANIHSVDWLAWVWEFRIQIPDTGASEPFLFSMLDNETIVQRNPIPAGLTLTIPLSAAGVAPGQMAVLCRETPIRSKAAKRPRMYWAPIDTVFVENTGNAVFTITETGRYAVGLQPEGITGTPQTGKNTEYDCVLDSEAIITMAKASEPSTSILAGAWIFTGMSPDAMPETSPRFVQNTPDGMLFARLENYGKRLRVRSPYANRFKAVCGTLSGQYIATMQGPYEVDASGEPAAEPLNNPYEQCGRKFDAPMLLRIIDRYGNYTSFTSEVLEPLRAAYDTPESINVTFGYFQRLREGYVAELWVQTFECTRQAGLATSMAHQPEVNLYVQGRLAILVDRRGGGPYVAVMAPVANATAPGIQFIDPYWVLVGGIIWEFYLGGPNNWIMGDVDLEYDAIADSLWVMHRGVNGTPGVYRYDHPISNGGDRPPDYALPLNSAGILDIYLDQAQDRLFVREMDLNSPHAPSETLHIYDQASTNTPIERTPITHIDGVDPSHPEQTGLLIVESLASRDNQVFIFRQTTQSIPGSYEQDGQEIAVYDIDTGQQAAQYRGWAAFGPAQSGPALPGFYDHMTDLLYLPTFTAWSGKNAIFVIENPTIWQSAWIVAEGSSPFWAPVIPVWREIQWPNSGTIDDLDVLEEDPEENPSMLAFVQTRDDPNKSQLFIIEEANTISGMATPYYQLLLNTNSTCVELINPPPPEE